MARWCGCRHRRKTDNTGWVLVIVADTARVCANCCHYLFQISSTDIPDLWSLQSVANGRSPAIHEMAFALRLRRREIRSWRNRMKTLSDVATTYEDWAQANEASADEILACLDSVAIDIQENHRHRASLLTAEAEELRAKAEELRNVDRRIKA